MLNLNNFLKDKLYSYDLFSQLSMCVSLQNKLIRVELLVSITVLPTGDI